MKTFFAIAAIALIAVSGAVAVEEAPDCDLEIRTYHQGVTDNIQVESNPDKTCVCLEFDCDEDFDPACVNYEFHKNFPGGSHGAGDVSHIHLGYDVTTEILRVKYDINRKNGHLANSAWLVVNDGPNPKGHGQELAIFYIDCLNIDAEGKGKVTAYAYSGANNSNSWKLNPAIDFNSDKDGNPLNIKATCDWAADNDSVSVGFEYPARDINDFNSDVAGWEDWKGVRFTEKVGIWFHPAIASEMTYTEEGKLKTYKIGKQSWYDANYLDAECVPLE